MSDKELIRICKSFARGITGNKGPNSMCYAVTLPLQGYLSILGIETSVVEGEITQDGQLWNHFWLNLEDGRILDATAGQFKDPSGGDMPNVFLGERPDWYKCV